MFNSEFVSRSFSDLLMEFVNRMRGMVSRRPTRETIQQRMMEPRSHAAGIDSVNRAEFATLTPSNPETWFIKLVEMGLRKYSDVIALGQSPLAEYVGLKPCGPLAHARWEYVHAPGTTISCSMTPM